MSLSFSGEDEMFMRQALNLAKQAAALGEVPVGAVLVRDGQIIATGTNNRESGKTALGHAELNAIAMGCEKVGGWRLSDCTLYVTLEPCPMCAGAILNARIDRVVFAAPDKRNGAFGSVLQMNDHFYNHTAQLSSGLLAEEATALLQAFFDQLRARQTRWNKQTHQYEPAAPKESS